MRNCIYLAFSLLALGFLFNCESEPKEKPLLITDLLPGYWELIDAKRNGKDVPSLKGAYFEFDTNKTISTNWSGQQVVSSYHIDGNAIVYQAENKDQKLDFTINSQDTLQFTTIMRKIWNFEFTLVKADKENK